MDRNAPIRIFCMDFITDVSNGSLSNVSAMSLNSVGLSPTFSSLYMIFNLDLRMLLNKTRSR